MHTSDADRLKRYERQMIFPGLGLDAQRKLSQSRAAVVGVGGLGSWAAELLARSGVGMLRLIDDDSVDLTNLHRQALYDESDAAGEEAKVDAAARRLRAINSQLDVEPVGRRLDAANIDALAADVDVILDGTDNFHTRFIINDYAVKTSAPWIFAGAVAAEAQTMTIIPHRTPCLRCIFDAPPPPCSDPVCRVAGVLGPAVATIAAIQAAEAVKILAGRHDHVSPYLLKLDLWDNRLQRIDAASACKDTPCPCCKGGRFDFLEG